MYPTSCLSYLSAVEPAKDFLFTLLVAAQWTVAVDVLVWANANLVSIVDPSAPCTSSYSVI